MARFILLYLRKGPKPAADIKRVQDIPGVTVINESLPRCLELQVRGLFAQRTLRRIPEWQLLESPLVDQDQTSSAQAVLRPIPHLYLV